MQRQSYLILVKTFGVAGAIATVSDIAQPLAPIASYVMGVSAISLVILILTKIIVHVWNEKMAISTYFSSGLFVLSSVLYVFQSQSVEATQHGVIASEVSMVAELQAFLGIASKQLENIERSVSSIETHVANIDDSVSVIAESVKSIDPTVHNIESKLDKVKQETSTDPRKELANTGMRWHYDHFLDALRNADKRAIELYLQGGMKFRDEDIEKLVSYPKPVVDMLAQHNALPKDSRCPDQISFYAAVSKSPDKTELVRNICGQHIKKLIINLDRLVAAEKTKIEADQIYNIQLEKDRMQCLNELQAITVKQYIAEIENYSNTGEKSIKTTVIRRLKGNNKILKILAHRNIHTTNQDRETKLQPYYQSLEQDIKEIIHKECMLAHPNSDKKIIQTEKLEQLIRQYKLLSKHYRA